MDANGWSILKVAKLAEDTEAWDQVQLRPGLLVDTVTTYDGEDYSCRDISTAELIQKIDSPQRPLKISFRDPEFDTAEAKALVEKSKAEQEKTGSKGNTTAGTTALSEGVLSFHWHVASSTCLRHETLTATRMLDDPRPSAC